jgi:ribosome recycling factor
MPQQDVLTRADQRMDSTVEDTRQKMGTVRTGRATIGILDGITVEYYGTPTALNQIAKLSVPEANLIVAQPFDQSILADMERAIMASDLGLNPSNDGKLVRIPIPPLTEERRKELGKKVRHLGEDAKTAVRQIRRDANEELKKLEKESTLSEDDSRRAQDEVQKVTDAHTEQIDGLTDNKEKELIEI